MASIFQLRRDTEANWLDANPILADGEVVIVTDKKYKKTGDGENTFTDLPKDSGGGGVTPEEVDGKIEIHNESELAHDDIRTELSNKVEQVDGMGLSTNDYSDDEKTKLAGIDENANNYELPTDVVQDADYQHTDNNLTDELVAEWNDKQDTISVGTGLSMENNVISFTGTTEGVTKEYVDTEVGKKVDKVTGMGLSTNDYTDDEKTKLAGIDEGANNYVLPTDVVQDAEYQHTDNNLTDELVAEWNGKEDGGTAQNLLNNHDTDTTAHEDIRQEIAAKQNELTAGTGIDITNDVISFTGETGGVTKEYVDTEVGKKVDKVDGKGLSTNDYTDDEQSKLSGIEDNANNYVLPSDVVQDADYQHTDNNLTDALVADWNAKQDELTAGTGIDITNNVISFTGETGGVTKEYVDTEVGKKVDKVAGKGLSTNDYTDTEQNKLAGIEYGANNYVLPTSVVQDADYQHTDNNLTDALMADWNAKQDELTAGTGIDITNNVISFTGETGDVTKEYVDEQDNKKADKPVQHNPTTGEIAVGNNGFYKAGTLTSIDIIKSYDYDDYSIAYFTFTTDTTFTASIAEYFKGAPTEWETEKRYEIIFVGDLITVNKF